MKSLEATPMSDADARAVVGPELRCLTYPQLADYSTIDDVVGSDGCAMILFLTDGPSSGHWCWLIKTGNTVQFGDPYGIPPDREKRWLSPQMLEHLGETQPLLSNLLRNSGCRIIYNKTKLQKSSPDINTCGRHCAVRLMHRDLSLAQYKRLIRDSGYKDPDAFVTAITSNILGH